MLSRLGESVWFLQHGCCGCILRYHSALVWRLYWYSVSIISVQFCARLRLGAWQVSLVALPIVGVEVSLPDLVVLKAKVVSLVPQITGKVMRQSSDISELRFLYRLQRLDSRTGVRYDSTWLILPVVICLSQRLSHACLSISFYTAKLRMAH